MRTRTPYALLLLLLSALAGTADAQQFATVESKLFDGSAFTFPRDLKGGSRYLLLLAMGSNRESGERQQKTLLAWSDALKTSDTLTADVKPYHFVVMKSPPFFVKGMVGSAVSETYQKGGIKAEQSAVLFVADLAAFAAAAGISIDEQATVVLADSAGKPLGHVKGEATPENLAALKQLIVPVNSADH